MLRYPLRALALLTSCACASSFATTNDRGLDARNFDPAVPACTDFFQHANGGWLASNPIPAAYSRWSLDDEINDRNLAMLKRILENAARNSSGGTDATAKIGRFYAAAMDEAAIEHAGIAPLQDDLKQIDRLRTADDVGALIAEWHSRGRDVLFVFQALEDFKHAGTVIAYAGQGGLGLPERDYYLRTDAKSQLLRVQYRQHIAHMLELLGERNAPEQAGWIVALETQLAKASLDSVSLREPANSYHIYSVTDADVKTPHWSWQKYFRAIGRADVTRFSLAQPDFFVAADKALVEVPLAHWQAYLRWRLIDEGAPFLGRAFVQADFDFHGATLRGAKEIKPRWKRVVASADSALGEVLGEAYVAEVLSPGARQRALALVDNLKVALRHRLDRLDWMSATTRADALAKLDTLGAKIGYPDRWRDYSTLQISSLSYYANMRAAATFEAHRSFAKLDRAVDKNEWDMTPQTINAYNNSSRNEIVFPAAQLLPPYFDDAADDALNYGGIGSVIGHEMLHSFDDQGSKFDAHGNLADWWSAADRAHFEARAKQLVDQFNAYMPLDGLHVNGQLTLGENIADLGGLLVAYDAFKLTAQGKGNQSIDGLTPDQRFFLSFAQTWRTAQRDAQLRLQLQSNEHAPAHYRVIGPLSDVPAFAVAFSCKPGDPMVRAADQRVDIW